MVSIITCNTILVTLMWQHELNSEGLEFSQLTGDLPEKKTQKHLFKRHAFVTFQNKHCNAFMCNVHTLAHLCIICTYVLEIWYIYVFISGV